MKYEWVGENYIFPASLIFGLDFKMMLADNEG